MRRRTKLIIVSKEKLKILGEEGSRENKTSLDIQGTYFWEKTLNAWCVLVIREVHSAPMEEGPSCTLVTGA